MTDPAPAGPGRLFSSVPGTLALLRERRLWAALELRRHARAFYRLHFLHAALRLGLLPVLRAPISADDAAEQIGASHPELVEPLLDVGVALGELALDHGRYRLRGRLARALAGETHGPPAAMVREWVGYHGSVFDWLPDGLQGRPADDYLARFGGIIAQSSRLVEPLVGSFARAAAGAAARIARAAQESPRLLEVGCGSAVYLRYAAAADPHYRGTGLEIDPRVARQAHANLDAWGIAGRFAVAVADARHLPLAGQPPFALVTLYNNIYYFQPAERVTLLGALRQCLRPGGYLALVSVFRTHDVDAATFDLVLRATPGCAPLPDRDELRDQLAEAGFSRIEFTRLALGAPLYGVLATQGEH